MEGKKVLFVTPEYEGIVKAGGLAPAVTGLAESLKRSGLDIKVVMPTQSYSYGSKNNFVTRRDEIDVRKKSSIDMNGITINLIPCDPEKTTYYDTSFDIDEVAYKEESQRAFKSAVGFAKGFGVFTEEMFKCWVPDLIHFHEWYTAASIPQLRAGLTADIPVVFTSHNMKYRGEVVDTNHTVSDFPLVGEVPQYRKTIQWSGDLFTSLLELGMHTADAITTVSPEYAEEVLQGRVPVDARVIRRAVEKDLTGILNGIDYERFDPEHDPHIVPFSRGNHEAMSYGKGANKLALHQYFNIEPDANILQIAMMSRLAEEKGIDVVLDALEGIGTIQDVRLLIVGPPDHRTRQTLYNKFNCDDRRDIATKVGDNIHIYPIFAETPLQHKVLAGSDFLLMPSRVEPCGLTHLEAMAYGTIPICTETGGLKDTVTGFDGSHGYGLVIPELTPETIVDAVKRAAGLYKDKQSFAVARMNAAQKRFTWEEPTEKYKEVYEKVMGR